MFASAGFKNDARVFLTVSDSEFATILARTESARGILSPGKLRQTFFDVGVIDPEKVDVLMRIIRSFATWGETIAREGPEPLLASLNAALHEDPEFAKSVGTLASRIRTLLVGNFDGLKLAEKAERVARSIGRQLRGVQLITDVRPVFDNEHTSVLAVVPMTTLKLTTVSNEEGSPTSTFEVQFSEAHLLQLGTLLAEAQKKLAVTKKLLSDKEIEIADCTMVMTEGDAV
jgi:nucleotide-binding universal stress UspA family protein